MGERLSEKTGESSGATEWSDLENQKFEGGKLDRSTEKTLRENEYVDAAKRSEIYAQGLGARDHAEKLAGIRERVEASYRAGDKKGAESQRTLGEKLESEKVVPTGREKMMEGKLENSTISRGRATEIIAKAEFSAREFANERVNPQNASDIFAHEKSRYQMLMKRYEKWRSKDYQEPKGFFKKLSHNRMARETMDELERFGFDPSRRSESSEAEAYSASRLSSLETVDFAKQRAEDYAEMAALTRGKNGRAVRKALKKHGFKELPKDWSDKNFTTHEIATMDQVARGAVNSLTYK